MRRVWTLASKDVLETRRDKMAAIFTILMPLAFTVFLGLILGGGESRYPLAVSDQDHGAAARQLVSELKRSEVVSVEMVTRSEVNSRVDADKAVAGLVIPSGYSQDLSENVKARLIVVRKSGSTAAMSALQEIRAASTGQAIQARATVAALFGAGYLPARPTSDAGTKAAGVAVRASLAHPSLTTRTVYSGSSNEVPSGFDLTSPGMIVNFILFSVSTAGIALIMERREGTLQRLFTTRATKAELIGGKIGGMMTITFAQQIVLILVGALLGVAYFNSPVALVLVMIGLSAMVSCLGLLLATLFKSEPALISATVMISMAMAAMSGGWFPLEITGPTFSAVGHALPTAWIIDAFRGISLKDWGVAQVLPAVGVAFAWAAGFFALGVWRFRSIAR
jgi:ABC-2 type transport system permease protein